MEAEMVQIDVADIFQLIARWETLQQGLIANAPKLSKDSPPEFDKLMAMMTPEQEKVNEFLSACTPVESSIIQGYFAIRGPMIANLLAKILADKSSTLSSDMIDLGIDVIKNGEANFGTTTDDE